MRSADEQGRRILCERQHLVEREIAEDVGRIHTSKQRTAFGSLGNANTVRQTFGFIARVLATENLMRELRPRGEAGINDVLGFRKEGMIGRANADQRFSKLLDGRTGCAPAMVAVVELFCEAAGFAVAD